MSLKDRKNAKYIIIILIPYFVFNNFSSHLFILQNKNHVFINIVMFTFMAIVNSDSKIGRDKVQ